LLELARLIGYELRPGGRLRLHPLHDGDGAGRSTQNQRRCGHQNPEHPRPNEKAQTLETSTAIEARVEWNASPHAFRLPQVMTRGLQELFFEGVDTRFQPGDAILIVGSEREEFLISEQWDFRFDSVVADADADLTRVTWWSRWDTNIQASTRRSARRPGICNAAARCSFGHHAPDPRLLRIRAASGLLTPSGDQWANYTLNPERIDLDIVYPKITAGSWVVFDSPPYRELSRVSQVTTTSASRFAISGKFTQFVPDAFEHSGFFDLRNTAVFAQSDPALAERPIRDPGTGTG
jgi:hypothetical protein